MLEDSSGINTNTNRGKGPVILCAVNRNIGFFFSFLCSSSPTSVCGIGSDSSDPLLPYGLTSRSGNKSISPMVEVKENNRMEESRGVNVNKKMILKKSVFLLPSLFRSFYCN